MRLGREIMTITAVLTRADINGVWDYVFFVRFQWKDSNGVRTYTKDARIDGYIVCWHVHSHCCDDRPSSLCYVSLLKQNIKPNMHRPDRYNSPRVKTSKSRECPQLRSTNYILILLVVDP